MKCPKCSSSISELDEICPKCNAKLEEYEDEKEMEINEDKTIFLRVFNAIQIIACVIVSIVLFSNEEIGYAITTFVAGFVLFVFVKGFKDIIELLDSINQKLKR